VEKVRLWLNGYHFMGPPSYVLAYKLKALKGDLKYWNKHVFEYVSFRKKWLLTELLDPDVKEGMQLLSQEDRDRRVVVKSNIDFLAS